jgi:hypothetical protein
MSKDIIDMYKELAKVTASFRPKGVPTKDNCNEFLYVQKIEHSIYSQTLEYLHEHCEDSQNIVGIEITKACIKINEQLTDYLLSKIKEGFH